MAETLFAASNLLLYGRVLHDLKYTFTHPDTRGAFAPADPPKRHGRNDFLIDQLRTRTDNEGNVLPESEPKLARIYAFSYEGHYYDMPKPAIFVVHGDGADPEEPRPAAPDPRVSRAPADADRTGVAASGCSFSEDIRVWTYDKNDFSIRMDVETGPLEQILLDAVLRPDQVQTSYAGADLRVRGADLRVSGADLRLRRNRGSSD
jgi:hypothetical protein